MLVCFAIINSSPWRWPCRDDTCMGVEPIAMLQIYLILCTEWVFNQLQICTSLCI